MFISLKGENGKDVLINAERIDGIVETSNSTVQNPVSKIFIGGSDVPYYVKASIKDITKKLVEGGKNIRWLE